MALSEQFRNKFFEYLSATGLDVEVTSEVLSHFPARDVEEPVTKAVLHEELALVRMELRTEMSELRDDLRNEFRTEMAGLRQELRTDFRTELHTEIGGLRAEIGRLETNIGTEVGGLRAEIGRLETNIGTEIGGFRAEIGRLDTNIGTEIDGLRSEFHSEIGRLDTKVDALAESVHRDLRDQIRWLIGTQIAVIAIMVALAAVVVTLVH